MDVVAEGGDCLSVDNWFNLWDAPCTYKVSFLEYFHGEAESVNDFLGPRSVGVEGEEKGGEDLVSDSVGYLIFCQFFFCQAYEIWEGQEREGHESEFLPDALMHRLRRLAFQVIGLDFVVKVLILN